MVAQLFLFITDRSYKAVEDLREISIYYELTSAVDAKNAYLAELCRQHPNHVIDSIVTPKGEDITRFRVPTPYQHIPEHPYYHHELNHTVVDRFNGELHPHYHMPHTHPKHHHYDHRDWIYQCILRIESGILQDSPPTKPVYPPRAPQDFTAAEITPYTVTFTWLKQEDLTDYHLQYCKEGTTEWAEAIPRPVNTSDTYTVTGLEELTAYTFVLTAVNQAGGATSTVKITTTDDSANNLPAIPVGLHASNITADSIQLIWEAQSDITGFTVDYKGSTETTWTSLAPLDPMAVGCTIDGLLPLTAYDYRLTAVNDNGTAIATGQATTLDAATP